MLAAGDLNVGSVCTSSLLHHQHVVDAARSTIGPAVICCEKPIASSVADAERMTDICDETGTELVVNHSFRFTDKLQRLRIFVQEENLSGTVHSVSRQFRMEPLRNSTHLRNKLVYLLGARADQVSGYISGETVEVDVEGPGTLVNTVAEADD